MGVSGFIFVLFAMDDVTRLTPLTGTHRKVDAGWNVFL